MTEFLTKVNKNFGHLAYLDSLRGLAALYVVMHHSNTIFHPGNWRLPLSITPFYRMFAAGQYSVDLFITLSGFCLMLPVIRNGGKLPGSVTVFFKKRIRRILPPYYLTIGLSLLLIATLIGYKTGSLWDNTLPITKKDIITHLILIQDIFADTCFKINYVLWTISVEWRIYLLFPFILICWRKYGSIITTIMTIILSNLLIIPLGFIHHFYKNLNITSTGICPHYFGLFTLGMLAAEIVFSEKHKYTDIRAKINWGLITTIFGAIAIIAYNITRTNKISIDGVYVTYLICDLLAGICFFCLLIYLGLNQKNWLYKCLIWKPLVFIGTFAYSIYLTHAPLLQLLDQYIIKPLNLASFISISILPSLMTVIIVPIAYIFFLTCEKPFLNIKK